MEFSAPSPGMPRTLRDLPKPAVDADAGAFGGKSRRSVPDEQGKMVATNVEGVLVRDRGHWLMKKRRTRYPEAGRNFSTA